MTFVISSLLLVPFLYAFSSIPDVCAAPRDSNFGKNSTCYDHKDGSRTCCWFTPDAGIYAVTCQTCTKNDNGEWSVCGDTWAKVRKGLDPGEIVPDKDPTIQEPPTTTEPKVPGDILPDNGEPTINDPPTTTEPKVLEPGKIEIPNLK